ncbi:MAG: hypothetical protein ACSHWW_13605 [Nonlabens sp.]|uniref:hypothetical protein n=1 Tax=Nonlabens sp. TaxID=1888209 RepID=UPI003EF28890
MSCSTQSETIENDLQPFIKEHFPECTYSIKKKNNHTQLIINSKEKLTDKFIKDKATITLGAFYKSFLLSSSRVSTETKLSFSIISANSKWESKKYDLLELGEMFKN